jgi:hypothetical protein
VGYASVQVENITLRQKQILTILSQHGKMAVRDISAFLENAPSNRTIGDDLAQLKKINLVASEGVGIGMVCYHHPLIPAKTIESDVLLCDILISFCTCLILGISRWKTGTTNSRL